MPTRAQVTQWIWIGIGIGLVLAVILVTFLITTLARRPAQEPQATLGPTTFDSTQVMTAPTPSIAAYAAALQFDTALGAADERRFDLEHNEFEKGGIARIEPEKGSYRIAEQDLASGRIIARLKSTVSAPSWGVGAGWTWWWVDRRGPNDGWRSVFIPEFGKPADRVERKDPLVITYHDYPWRQAIARFTHSTWGTCNSGRGCCGQN